MGPFEGGQPDGTDDWGRLKRDYPAWTFRHGGVQVRDTKQHREPERTVLHFTALAWREFTRRIPADYDEN